MKNGTNSNPNWFIDYLKGNPLQVTLQIIGLGVLILNLYLTTKLAPLAQDLQSLTGKVEALEKSSSDNDIFRVDVSVIKEQVESINKKLEVMQEDLQYLIRK